MAVDSLHIALNNIRYTYVILMICTGRIRTGDWSLDDIDNVQFGSEPGKGIVLDLAVLKEAMGSGGKKDHFLDQAHKALRRMFLREPYELILYHCKKTKQMDKLKGQSWYPFARLVRNCASHELGGVLTRWPKWARSFNEITWRDKTLKPSMVGQNIQMDECDAYWLFTDMWEFAESGLE